MIVCGDVRNSNSRVQQVNSAARQSLEDSNCERNVVASEQNTNGRDETD
jgi:hypothetical protein